MVQIQISTATRPGGQLHDLHSWLGWPPARSGDAAALERAIAAASVERGMFIGPERLSWIFGLLKTCTSVTTAM